MEEESEHDNKAEDKDAGDDSDPESSGAEEVYEVEKILAQRKRNGNLEYKIKWKGYSTPTWEAESAVQMAQEAVQEFKDNEPLVPPEHSGRKKKSKRATSVVVEVAGETTADKMDRKVKEYQKQGCTWSRAREKAQADMDAEAVQGSSRRRVRNSPV